MDKRSGRPRILVTGSGGRLGRLLRQVWVDDPGARIAWQSRQGGTGTCLLDPLTDRAALVRAAEGADAILALAGVVRGDRAALARNSDLAVAAARAAHAAGARAVLIASSAAVYGAAKPPQCEDGDVAPVSDYGRAKLAMEEAALAVAQEIDVSVCALRIANVAGADALLAGNDGRIPVPLDLLDGRALRRSYVGPRALASILMQLCDRVADGERLPDRLNVALEGAVGMDALLGAAGRQWVGRPAADGAIAEVELDVTRLKRLAALPHDGADAAAIVADWRSVCGDAGGLR